MKKIFLLWTICIVMVIAMGCKKTPSQDMVVAIVDTGIDKNNPELKDHLWKNNTSLPGTYGYDFINGDDDPQDDQGHGTHCAGVILEQAKKEGIDSHVKFMAIKYLDEKGSADLKRAIEGYKYIINAKKQGVNVVAINNSWGVEENSPELKKLIEEAGKLGILSFQASGNTGVDLDINKTYPAGYRSPYTVVVAATTPKNQLANFSCYGKTTVNIAAPGTGIVAPYFKDFYIPQDNLDKDKVWNLIPSKEEYKENSNKTYKNIMQWKIDPNSEFWGIDYQYQGTEEKYAAVEARSSSMWMNIGMVPLRKDNFTDTQVFALPKGTKEVRLIAYEASAGDKITLEKVGAGKNTGKYAKLSGTSMAAPYVVGGYLKLYSESPNAEIKDLRNQLLSHVVPLKSENPIEGNGIFDLNAASQPVVNQYSKGIFYGDFFGTQQGKITVNGKDVKIIKWGEHQIEIEPPVLPLGINEMSISTPNGFPRTYSFYLHAKWEGYHEEASMPKAVSNGVACTFSDQIILLGGSIGEQNNQDVYSYRPQENTWKKIGTLNEQEGNILSIGASAATYEGKSYISAFDDMTQKSVFYTYTPQEGLKPLNAHISNPITRGELAVFHNELYLIGGIDKSTEKQVSYIFKYHPENQTFEKVATLHQQRYSPLVFVEKDRMYLVGGFYGENLPVKEIEYFDGKEVKVVSQNSDIKANLENGQVIDQNYLITDGLQLRNGRYVDGKFVGENLPLGKSVCHNFMATSYQGKGYIFGGTEDLNPTTRVYSFDLKEAAEKNS